MNNSYAETGFGAKSYPTSGAALNFESLAIYSHPLKKKEKEHKKGGILPSSQKKRRLKSVSAGGCS